MEEKKKRSPEGRTDSDNKPAVNWDKSITQLSQDIEKLREFTTEHVDQDNQEDDDDDDDDKNKKS